VITASAVAGYDDSVTDAVKTVILLEDDLALRSLLADGLEEAQYTVVQTGTGAEADAAIDTVAGKAVLVADRSVSSEEGPNGFQIAAAALERYPALRVIYISGTHIAIRRRTMGKRERGLMKPFAMSQLMATLRDLGVS
jgi:DNA-binding NtrC family response regulator